MQFKNYVKHTVRKSNKEASLWVNLGIRSSKEVQTVTKVFGTASPKEISQIVVGLCSDLDSKKIKIVEGAPAPLPAQTVQA